MVLKKVIILFVLLCFSACASPISSTYSEINNNSAESRTSEKEIEFLPTEDSTFNSFDDDAIKQDNNRENLDFADYVPPILTNIKEFDHSKYVLLTATVTDSLLGCEFGIPEYALLGNGVNSYEEGKQYYNQIDSIFFEEYDMVEPYSTNVESYNNYETMKKLLFERHVVRISNDGERYLTFAYDVKSNITDNDLLLYPYKYSFFTGKTLVYEHTNYNSEGFDLSDNFYSNKDIQADLKGFFTSKYENGKTTSRLFQITDSGKVIATELNKRPFVSDGFDYYAKLEYGDTDQVCVYSIPNNKLIFSYTPEPQSGKISINLSLDQLINGKLLISEAIDKDAGPHTITQSIKTYLIDIATGEKRLVGENMISPLLSPNEKHIAYISIDETQYNLKNKSRAGYYITNLENNTTVFYNLPNSENLTGEDGLAAFTVCWAKKAGIDQLINH